MVTVSYHCPYCGAVTTLDRDAYLEDRCVTREPLAGWEYAATTDDYESADGVEFVCIGDAPGEGSDAAADRPAGDAPGKARDAAADRPAGDAPGEGSDAAADRPAGDAPGEGSAPAAGPPTGASDGEDGPDPAAAGCGRTFYLSFVKFEVGSELEPPGGSLEDEPSFEFLR